MIFLLSWILINCCLTSLCIKYWISLQAQKLLDDMLEKTLVMVRDPIDVPDNDPKINEGGIHLFKNAPSGIVFDYIGKSISSYALAAFTCN